MFQNEGAANGPLHSRGRFGTGAAPSHESMNIQANRVEY